MNAPITYYGGKQKMLKHILPLIPQHSTYVEPFAGGAAVFFAKPKTNAEYINDINGNVAAFYRAMKNSFSKLQSKIEGTIHCEYTHQTAKDIYFNEDKNISDIERAWAFWVNSRLSFGGCMGSSFKFVKNKRDNWTAPKTTQNKKRQFAYFQKRLENAVVFNKDAIDIIKRLDDTDVFFYIDPPYVGANQGHYGGYTEAMFYELIKLLKTLKGKFLLSSYPHEYIHQKGWGNLSFDKALGVQSKGRKTEVLTYNYTISQPATLF